MPAGFRLTAALRVELGSILEMARRSGSPLLALGARRFGEALERRRRTAQLPDLQLGLWAPAPGATAPPTCDPGRDLGEGV